MSLVRDIVYAGVGLKRLLSFQDNWRECFDVSYEGVTRSFRAAWLTLPFYAFIMLGFVHLVAAYGRVHTGYSPGFLIFEFARLWLVFPIVAAFVCTVFGRKRDYGLWLTAHNWAILAIIALQALLLMVFLAGLLPAEAVAFTLAIPVRILVLAIHWRIATSALNLSWGTGAAAATLHIVVDLLVQTGIGYAFPPPSG